jgi:hypothetical protein
MRGLTLIMVAGLTASCSCEQARLQPLAQSIRFELIDPEPGTTQDQPLTLQFVDTWATGTEHLREVNIVNDGRSTLEVSWSSLGLPFEARDLPATLDPGSTTITVRFATSNATSASDRLEVTAPGVEKATLLVQATALAVPPCRSSGPCLEAQFDPAEGKCVETTSTDGTACPSDSLCLEQTKCQAGRCVGKATSCDDEDACTVDVCYPLTGCQFVPAPPCPGEGACQVGVCDRVTGCGLAAALDGVACGSLQTCNAAQVCIDGACVVRDPPDGYVCEEPSPCTDEGRCVADQCVHQRPPTVLTPLWQYDSATDVDPGEKAAQYHDFVLEPTGELTLGGFFFSPPLLRANTTRLAAPRGGARRCILWNGRVVCADYPADPNGRVSAINQLTGVTEWSFDIRTERPDFLALTSTIFMARLVVQSSDRLAALFESYPRNPAVAGSALCRAYFLAVIDARGGLVTAQRVVDPLLDGCNHPHPYGVAADSVGNLYIAFSPTFSDRAPLAPATPTLIMSYTRDGIFRWKRTDPTLRGGELAIARGLLYPENSSVVLHAPSGLPAFALPSELGRAVISDTRLVPAPLDGARVLQAFETGGVGLRWTNTLPTGWAFWGEQLRLASWSTSRGPRTVALSLITEATGSGRALYGIDVINGLTAFSCPLEVGTRTEPQLLEVANGSLAIMNGALDPEDGGVGCLKCDPPLARSSAVFQTYEVPWLSVANESWVGTFGGAGHDHREE